MEYVNGGSWKRIHDLYLGNNSRTFPERIVKAIVTQWIQGLKAMNNADIIHKRLTLGNVLVKFPIGNEESNITAKKMKNVNYLNYQLLENTPYLLKLAGYSLFKAEKSKNENDYLKYNTRLDLLSLGLWTYEWLIGNQAPQLGKITHLLNNIGQYPNNITLSIESISFINALCNYETSHRIDWDEIEKHPFISRDVSTFTTIELNKIEIPDIARLLTVLTEKSKNCNNNLWLMYNTNSDRFPTIDKILFCSKFKTYKNGSEIMSIDWDAWSSCKSWLWNPNTNTNNIQCSKEKDYTYESDVSFITKWKNEGIELENEWEVMWNCNEDVNTATVLIYNNSSMSYEISNIFI